MNAGRLGWVTTLPNNIPSLFHAWPNTHEQIIYHMLWTITPSIMLWELWKEINRCIFKERKLTIDQLNIKIEAQIVEIVKSKILNRTWEEAKMTHWDEKM